MSGKYALIIGNTEYIDPGLAQLTAPGKDTEDFARILKDKELCAFDDVKILFNKLASSVIEAIDEFFDQRKPDDLLVLYFSGHGVRDETGSLYLAVKNTIRSRLRSTAIRTDYIREAMDQSRSKRQILVLDCCNSGAFPQGTKAEVGGMMGMARAFQGYGRFVLTASDATQFAWEGDKVIGQTENSLFTHFLVKGLEGEADSDGDGKITVDELYDYAYDQISRVTPKQTPTKSSSKQEGEIILRQITRLQDIRPVSLSEELIEATQDSRTFVREGAIRELEKLLNGKNLGLARSARDVLERMEREDDSRRVSQGATQVLEPIRQAEQKVEEERKAREEAEHLMVLKAEEERLAGERVQAERKAREEAERLAIQKADVKRLAQEKAEAERKAREEAERLMRVQAAREEMQHVAPAGWEKAQELEQIEVQDKMAERDKAGAWPANLPFYKIWISAITRPTAQNYEQIAAGANLSRVLLWMLAVGVILIFVASITFEILSYRFYSIISEAALAISSPFVAPNAGEIIIRGLAYATQLCIVFFVACIFDATRIHWIGRLFKGRASFIQTAYSLATFGIPVLLLILMFIIVVLSSLGTDYFQAVNSFMNEGLRRLDLTATSYDNNFRLLFLLSWVEAFIDLPSSAFIVPIIGLIGIMSGILYMTYLRIVTFQGVHQLDRRTSIIAGLLGIPITLLIVLCIFYLWLARFIGS